MVLRVEPVLFWEIVKQLLRNNEFGLFILKRQFSLAGICVSICVTSEWLLFQRLRNLIHCAVTLYVVEKRLTSSEEKRKDKQVLETLSSLC